MYQVGDQINVGHLAGVWTITHMLLGRMIEIRQGDVSTHVYLSTVRRVR